MLDRVPDMRARIDRLMAQTRATMARIHDRFPAERAAVAQWRETLPVALVLGAPRGGTSAFKAALARHPNVLAMPGEHRLFFTLAGMNYPLSANGREARDKPLPPDLAETVLDLVLTAAFAGPELDDPDDEETLRFALDWALRLPLQWTGYKVDPDTVFEAVLDAVALYRRGPARGIAALDAAVMAALRVAYPFVDPTFYDGAPAPQTVPAWPDLAPALTPVVEITPFVRPRPRALKRTDLDLRVLLLKASSDPYRLATLRALFGRRPVTVLRLVRNPMASINGLLDGWAHHGFWQHDLREVADVPPPLRGWCFDLFPGWRAAARAGDLQDIAAQQWAAPNRILNAAEARPARHETWHRFRFEAFQSGADARRAMLTEALEVLDLPQDPALAPALADPPRVNATHAPQAARWRRDRPGLTGLLDRPDLAGVAQDTGYDRRHLDGWI